MQNDLRRRIAATFLLSAGILAIASLGSNSLAKEAVLYGFQGAPDGSRPMNAAIADKHGNLFGTTSAGGTGSCSGGCGTIFELSPRGKGAWSESVLYSFQSGGDGDYPDAALVMDTHGNLYGVTQQGGNGDCTGNGVTGCGIVFELSPDGKGGWTESVLHNFQGTGNGNRKSDASWPNALILGRKGQLIGAAYNGGTCPPPYTTCAGAIFELTKRNGAWQEKIIYSADVETAGPTGVMQDANGNLYSVSPFGGPENVGSVFMITPPAGEGEWTATVLYDFQNQNDGALPVPGLAFDAAGNLFGASDGTDSVGPNIFELTPNANGPWTESVIISFDLGYYPSAGPVLDSKGNMFGTTSGGGKFGNGIAFRISPNNGGWSEKALYSFAGGNDGAEPLGSVLLEKNGTLYGTTYAGGGAATCHNGCGTVFRLTQ